MDASETFFNQLGHRGHVPALETVTGSVRFDLQEDQGTDHFRVALTHGAVAVTKDDTDADCVLTARRAIFDDIASGDTTLLVALLRGDLGIQGDVGMLVLFQRLFPVRQHSSGRSAATDTERAHS
ncbi:SCP2 sterol-binding domain-containing protein [Sphaerobacter sp.]|uniref:SCP2 sterol-binding domain-containing protein n=1 Tax=Sphaerobacter sp. TaxID=2099654 RepID=UPI001D22B1C4|nr:SCP2 sterol-binding domain-containing protein [Sphaerobacter sp.]MBX5444918.1 SCP2 sterol-binding domain-containing protein [Sphaerobacter sp.]